MAERASVTGESARDQSREVARIAAFSDGVFAIAITLLALQLEVPASGDLAAELAGLLPSFLSFAISFLVIGTYWVVHHRLFSVIERYDARLIWLNMLVLLFIVVQPFTSSLVGERGDQPLAVAVYAVTLALVGLATSGLAAYALLGHRLCSPHVSERSTRFSIWRGLVVALIFLGSLVLLPLGTEAVQYAWLSIPLAQYLIRRRYVTRGEE